LYSKLKFIIGQFETITEKYDYACLVSYILLSELDLNYFAINKFVDERSIIDTSNDDVLRKFFTKNLIDYLKANNSMLYFGSNLKEKDSQVKRFLIMLNLIRTKNLRGNFDIILSHFGQDMNNKIEKDIKEILKILEILK